MDRPIDYQEGDEQRVLQRLVSLIERHQFDDTAAFDRWFYDASGSVFKAMANLAGFPEGKLSIPRVRYAMIELGWTSFQFIGRCLDEFANAFAAALPEPLSDREKRYFDAIYRGQSQYGGLPLVMVMQHHQLLRPVVLRTLEHPHNAHLNAILHALLHSYSEIVAARREADRRRKSRKNRNSPATLECADSDWLAELSRKHTTPPVSAWEELGERLSIGCQRSDCELTFAGQVDTQGKTIVIEGFCSVHGPLAPQEVSFSEATELMNPEQPASGG
jgi:hypothetical protein